MMNVAVFGYTGLVGKDITTQLTESSFCSKILTIGRGSPENNHPKIHYSQTDFQNMETFWPEDQPCDAAIWCLGSTLKKAGSKQNFYHIDFTLAVNAAKKARSLGIHHWILISSAGANAQSYFFYNQVKGKLEDACLDLHFPKTTILRPSLLIGKRKESRPLESFSQKLLQPLASSHTRWFDTVKPVYAQSVAKAAIRALETQKSAVVITHSGEITRQTHKREPL